MVGPSFPVGIFGIFLLSFFFLSCVENNSRQEKYEPYEFSSLFSDGNSSRPRIPGTVARGELQEEIPPTANDLKRGRERYDIYCSVCHGKTGRGDGAVVERGFPRPPDLLLQRLKEAPADYFFQIITQGMGRMQGYGDRLNPADRHQVIAYIRSLQEGEPP